MRTFCCVIWGLVLTVVVLGGADVLAQDDEVVPVPMPLLDFGDYEVVTFLLLGSDTSNPQNAGRTDVIMLVFVNRTANTLSMLSVPRDLYVYIPERGMQRINTAYGFGENGGGEGGGSALLIETVRHNLGIEVDYHARVDFNDFRDIVNGVGGVEIAVDCAIQDWRLTEPGLDPSDANNWELFTLPVGMHLMDGDLALWYARSRRTSSDFDRGHRHQALMLALWRRVTELGLLNQLPDIWTQVVETVDTDVTLQDAVGLLPVLASIDASQIQSFTLTPYIEVEPGVSPEGANILHINRGAMLSLEDLLITPPTERQLVQERPTVAVINASGVEDLALVVADRLSWEGFVPVVVDGDVPQRRYTSVVDYTGSAKSTSLSTIQDTLRVTDAGVRVEPNAEREFDFRVEVGSEYFACTRNVIAPTATATPAAAGAD